MRQFFLPLISVIFAVVPASAAQLDIVFDPARTTIEFTLDATMHKVHGTFQLDSGTVRYDPATGTASGTIVVDARSGDSGNMKRDRDMHGKVLDSDAHPTIVLVPERVVGELPFAGSGDMLVVGSFRIGGGEHTVEIPLAVTVTGDEVEIGGRFEVPYVEWGLKDPSKFVLRVGKEVAVNITAYATVTPAADAGTP
jgi:polyisoprenoid-binding protein YceI